MHIHIYLFVCVCKYHLSTMNRSPDPVMSMVLDVDLSFDPTWGYLETMQDVAWGLWHNGCSPCYCSQPEGQNRWFHDVVICPKLMLRFESQTMHSVAIQQQESHIQEDGYIWEILSTIGNADFIGTCYGGFLSHGGAHLSFIFHFRIFH